MIMDHLQEKVMSDAIVLEISKANCGLTKLLETKKRIPTRIKADCICMKSQ
jgi:hypothetical protein